VTLHAPVLALGDLPHRLTLMAIDENAEMHTFFEFLHNATIGATRIS
jgi:hypothetical protein